MNKFKMINRKSFFRAFLVATISLLVCFLMGTIIKEVINTLYMAADSRFWFSAFRLLSSNELLIYLMVCLISISLFSNWIFAPPFIDFAKIIAQSLRISDDEILPIQLPKSMISLEADLSSINKEIKLWKYAVLEAEQRKNDLVAYLAHDIRTPLTSILGYLGLLYENPNLSPEQKQKFIDIALRKSERMQLLVEELFEVTRYNISHIELEKTEVNASIMLNQLIEELAPLLDQKQIQVELSSDGSIQLYIDAEKMARAIDNVLHNAANYTPGGGKISICVSQEENIHISISNTGFDISQERLDRFFEKFYRGDEARKSSSGGSGLGLAIAKSIIEAHSGSISAHNQSGITTFTIVL